jgi:hypothetical protein
LWQKYGRGWNVVFDLLGDDFGHGVGILIVPAIQAGRFNQSRSIGNNIEIIFEHGNANNKTLFPTSAERIGFG